MPRAADPTPEHNGPVVGSILAGSAVYQIEAQPATVLQPGEPGDPA
jgi:hypothetical protein